MELLNHLKGSLTMVTSRDIKKYSNNIIKNIAIKLTKYKVNKKSVVLLLISYVRLARINYTFVFSVLFSKVIIFT